MHRSRNLGHDPFSNVPNNNQVWIDLHRLIQDEDDYVRWCAVEALGLAYSHIPDKNQAWADLIHLVQDKHNDVRWRAVQALSLAYPHVPDKNQAWEDMHRLTLDDDEYVRRRATQALGSIFIYIPDKNQAWADLHRRISDRDNWVRGRAAEALGSAYPHVPDKNQAWADLIHLVQDKHEYVQLYASQSLSSVYPQVPDKNFAWKDLHILTKSVEDGVRKHVAEVLGSVYLYIPDKNQAWTDLHNLSMDKNTSVRRNAANALGSGYPHIPDKKQAWVDLQRLTRDKNTDVRIYAYYSIGRASIFKATESTSLDDFRKKIEEALKYFNHSSKEDNYLNPAEFCILFYRSFYLITFKPQGSEIVVKKYLAEAKKKVAQSESKEKLLEAIENLSDALNEVFKAKDLYGMKYDLKKVIKYYETAEKLLDEAKEKAPKAVKLVRIGIPIGKDYISELLAEIQEKAKIVCQQSKGKPTEEIACVVKREVQRWYIDDLEQMTKNVKKLLSILNLKIPSVPEYIHIHNKIEDISVEPNMTLQYEKIIELIGLIPTTFVHIGDEFDVSNVKGEIIQIGSGIINENTSTDKNAPPNKSLIERFNSPATFAAFIGFLIAEIGTYFYPIIYNHLISVVVAIIVFIIGVIVIKR